MRIISERLFIEIDVEISVQDFWEEYQELKESYRDQAYVLSDAQEDILKQDLTLENIKTLIKYSSCLRDAVVGFIAYKEEYQVVDYGFFSPISKKLYCTFKYLKECE